MPLFRKLICRPMRTRGEMDAAETWKAVLEQYDEILKDYQAFSAEDQEAARKPLNEIEGGFGDTFYTGKGQADLEWTQCDEEQCKQKLALFFQDNYFNWDE